jgi:hypothetical protein
VTFSTSGTKVGPMGTCETDIQGLEVEVDGK